jgi:type IV pilus assembly protein PilC
MTDVIIRGPVATPRGSTEGAHVPWYKQQILLGRDIKPVELMNFSRQTASFLRAGVPILDALGIVVEENGSKRMTVVLGELQRRIRGGSSLGDALAAHPRAFPRYFVAVVRAAELTGRLDDALDQLATYLERDIAARRQVKSALTYPSFVMAMAVVAVFIMAMYVLPKFKGFYRNLGANLPLPTRMLMGFTDFVGAWWFALAAFAIVLVVVAYVCIGGNHGKDRRDRLVLRLPGIGSLVQLIVIERFCRVLAALVDAGVSLPEAVRVSAESTNHSVYQIKLAEAREAMMRGEGLAGPMTATGLFPAAARQMMRVGETTGSLDAQLDAAATFYERELNYRLKRLTDLFEPVVVLTVGAAVGFVAIAQVAAMYSIYHQVRI